MSVAVAVAGAGADGGAVDETLLVLAVRRLRYHVLFGAAFCGLFV